MSCHWTPALRDAVIPSLHQYRHVRVIDPPIQPSWNHSDNACSTSCGPRVSSGISCPAQLGTSRVQRAKAGVDDGHDTRCARLRSPTRSAGQPRSGGSTSDSMSVAGTASAITRIRVGPVNLANGSDRSFWFGLRPLRCGPWLKSPTHLDQHLGDHQDHPVDGAEPILRSRTLPAGQLTEHRASEGLLRALRDKRGGTRIPVCRTAGEPPHAVAHAGLACPSRGDSPWMVDAPRLQSSSEAAHVRPE